MGTPNDNTPYYADDISLMPVRVIWRSIRVSNRWPVRIPLLLYFLACKLVGSRGVAVYGLARPDTLTKVDWNSVPAENQSAVQPAIDVCRDTGFRPVANFQSQTIGTRRAYSLLWLHLNRYVYATIVWIEIRRGGQSRSKTVFSCHSARSNGENLDTVTYTRSEWNPEIFPPGHDFLNIWPETNPQKIVEAHLKRTKSEFNLHQFDDESLEQHLLDISQQLFDHMINKGFYARLSNKEVERLRQQTI